MNTYRIIVEDMMCQNCVKHIKEAFEPYANTSVSCNLSKKEVELYTDLSVEDIYRIIEEADYTPSDLEML